MAMTTNFYQKIPDKFRIGILFLVDSAADLFNFLLLKEQKYPRIRCPICNSILEAHLHTTTNNISYVTCYYGRQNSFITELPKKEFHMYTHSKYNERCEYFYNDRSIDINKSLDRYNKIRTSILVFKGNGCARHETYRSDIDRELSEKEILKYIKWFKDGIVWW